MKKYLPLIVFSVIIILGFGVRVIDLSDLPLDFHPTRQLHSAIVARAIYARYDPLYDHDLKQIDQQLAQTLYHFEPSILETIVAGFYLLFGEHLWIPRLLNIFLWMIGVLFVYSIARNLSGDSIHSKWVGLYASAIYLFTPPGIEASRSFQPDTLMVVLTIISLYGAIKFIRERNWQFLYLASLSGAFAILIKGFAIYFIGPIFLCTVLQQFPMKDIKNTIKEYRLYGIAVILLLPILYYLLRSDFSGGSYLNTWFLSVSSLLLTVRFYVSWLRFFQLNFTFWLCISSLVGIFFMKKNHQFLFFSIWFGYFIYCFSNPHQTMTHDYYHLIATPLIALSSSLLINILIQKISDWSFFPKFLTGIALLGIVIFNLWQTGSKFLEVDYRDRAAYWQEVSSQLPENANIVALTQDYGYPMIYWGRRALHMWPDSGELYLANIRNNSSENFNALIEEHTADYDLFLVTDFEDFNRQTNLQNYLFSETTLIQEDENFLLFKLK